MFARWQALGFAMFAGFRLPPTKTNFESWIPETYYFQDRPHFETWNPEANEPAHVWE